MRRTIAMVIGAGAIAAATLAAGGTANAAHCTDRGGPGNSDFATHVRGASGPGGHNEGDHRGWSSCIPGNPNFTG